MASVEFCVRVTNRDGAPLADTPVSVFYSMSSDEQLTDQSGTACFTRELLQEPIGSPQLKVKIVAAFNHKQEVWVGDGDTIAFIL